MKNRQSRTEAALLASERRNREDEAPRLRVEVPRLQELSIEIDEYRGDSPVLGARHTRRVVVDHAPALFELPCTEERCTGGGYDVTFQMMRSLKDSETEFVGEDGCMGQVGSDPCGRTLRYVAHAGYSDD